MPQKAVGVICRMQNVTTVYYSKSVEVNPCKNKPNPIVLTISLTLTLKLLNLCEWKVFMTVNSEKLAIFVFPLT